LCQATIRACSAARALLVLATADVGPRPEKPKKRHVVLAICQDRAKNHIDHVDI